ncbi:MAG: hypothetical protein K0R38_2937 [Polyangiaceae bacterium]|jgi:hypothetical protein|nr:hypothetical protein [Polyangiaceae bacterium]
MNTFILKGRALPLLLLSACGNFQTPTVTDTLETPVPEAVGELSQNLDTQGFFEARGYFQNNDTVAGDCVAGPGAGDPAVVPVQAPNAGGQQVVFSLALLESSADVHSRLSLDASASAKFLVAGGDAKFQFAEATGLSETKVTLLAAVSVRNNAWTVPPGIKFRTDVVPMLTGVAGAAPTDAQLQRFRQRCGDGFLHSYVTGGEYYAMIQVETQTKAETESIKAHIAGNYLTFSASADFEKTMSKIVSTSKTLVRTYQIGGEGTTTSPCSDVQCVAKRIDEFTTAVTAKPVVFATEVKPYSLLKMPKDGTKLIDISTARDQMELINRQRDSTRDLISRFGDVLDNPSTYVLGANTLASIGTALNTANDNLNTLNTALRSCGRTPTGCKVPAIKSIAVTVPGLKPMPTRVALRSYAKPSSYILDAGSLSDCDNPFLRISAVENPDSLEPFRIVPGLNGAPRTFSFQSEIAQKHMSVRLESPCVRRVKLTVPRSEVEKNRASFYRERGLNGRPNTWSFRLYGNPSGEELYLTRSRVSPISVTAHPELSVADEDMDAFKNDASWYMDEL